MCVACDHTALIDEMVELKKIRSFEECIAKIKILKVELKIALNFSLQFYS
jgi:virulence-associated protein VapD